MSLYQTQIKYYCV